MRLLIILFSKPYAPIFAKKKKKTFSILKWIQSVGEPNQRFCVFYHIYNKSGTFYSTADLSPQISLPFFQPQVSFDIQKYKTCFT